MGSVTCTSLAYIALKDAEPLPLEERLDAAIEMDEWDNIIALKVDGNLPIGWGLLVAEEVRTVRKIELSGSRVTNEVFAQLQTLPELNELHIHSDEIGDKVMSYIAKIKTLKSLIIAGNITDRGFKFLEQMQQLTNLDVEKTAGTDKGMQFLSKLTNLESLAVPLGVSDRGLVHLQDMQLKSLVLPASAKTDIGLEHYISACEPQAKIDLTPWEGVQGPGLIHLRKWAELKEIILKAEDKAMPYVGQLVNLEHLSINDSMVSDAAVEYVSDLYLHLKTLNISGTNITQQGFARLRLALPGCTITGRGLRSRIDHATYQSGYPALEFDGVASYLSVGSFQYDGTYELTAEAWLWPEIKGVSGSIMGNARQAGFTFSLTSDCFLTISFHGHGATARATSDNSIPVREWAHVAFFYDGDKVSLFVNGVQQTQQSSVRGEHKASRKRFMIGADPSYTNKPTSMFACAIREVRLSRSARYTQSFTPAARFQLDTETIALYHMDAMEGDRVEDATGNGHTAWINGATWLAAPSDDDHKFARQKRSNEPHSSFRRICF